MIGSSVVPGLPNRCVMPSSLSNARKADRPVMRFFILPPTHDHCRLISSWLQFAINRIIRVAHGLAAIERRAVIGRERKAVFEAMRQIGIGRSEEHTSEGVGMALRNRGFRRVAGEPA